METKPESGPLESMPVPPKSFGDGWLTNNAADLCRVAIAFGGFEPGEIVLAVTKLQRDKAAKANCATVEKVLQLLLDTHVAADSALYADVIEDRKKAQEFFRGLKNA